MKNLICFLLSFLLALPAYAHSVSSPTTGLFPSPAHSGGLDANGCHAGSQPYHCHTSDNSGGGGTSGGSCPGWHVDHIRPLSCGGADAVSNLQWLTAEENLAKGGCRPSVCQGPCQRSSAVRAEFVRNNPCPAGTAAASGGGGGGGGDGDSGGGSSVGIIIGGVIVFGYVMYALSDTMPPTGKSIQPILYYSNDGGIWQYEAGVRQEWKTENWLAYHQFTRTENSDKAGFSYNIGTGYFLNPFKLSVESSGGTDNLIQYSANLEALWRVHKNLAVQPSATISGEGGEKFGDKGKIGLSVIYRF